MTGAKGYMPFRLTTALEGSDPIDVAVFGDYRAARAAAIRRLSMLDLARPGGADAPQVNLARVYFNDELVFEATRDRGRVIIEKEVIG